MKDCIIPKEVVNSTRTINRWVLYNPERGYFQGQGDLIESEVKNGELIETFWTHDLSEAKHIPNEEAAKVRRVGLKHFLKDIELLIVKVQVELKIVDYYL